MAFMHNFARDLLGYLAVLTIGLYSTTLQAQSRTPETAPTPLQEAQAALERRDWVAAESLLAPIIKAEPKNPFAYFELAQLYENTNRLEAARNIYQAIAAIPEAEKANYVVIAIKDNQKYMVLLPNLAQEKLTALSTVGISPVQAAPPPPSSTQSQPAVIARSATPTVVAPTDTHVSPARSQSAIENTPAVIAMRQWIAAWQAKRVDVYFASYLPGYRGDMASQTAWQNARAQRINSKSKININAFDVSVLPIDAQQVQVNFTQAYVSSSVVNLAQKSLLMVYSNGRWLISKETVK